MLLCQSIRFLPFTRCPCKCLGRFAKDHGDEGAISIQELESPCETVENLDAWVLNGKLKIAEFSLNISWRRRPPSDPTLIWAVARPRTTIARTQSFRNSVTTAYAAPGG